MLTATKNGVIIMNKLTSIHFALNASGNILLSACAKFKRASSSNVEGMK